MLGMELEMARIKSKRAAEKIFDNILFLAEIFGDQPEREIPKLPVLEMARCFELKVSNPNSGGRRRTKVWPLWK